ncbi:hypothetical protein M0R45_030161 [Rubus argutus]|uniref:E3 ubiquitin-protein ligase RMA n=1 Tax=Rubus argutus TaxID=59490 RepID=A0AAW1WDW0_RUBAR
MGEETSDAMNLDLNLGPGPEPASAALSNEPGNLENWIDQPFHRIAEVIGLGPFRRRWPQPEAHNVSSELNQLMVDSGTSSILQAGEGSVAAEGRINDVPKLCENINGILENETSEDKDDVEKSSGNDGSFFDCNICLDLARDPVLTCCGHLFCWPCLYRWLHVHSDAKECPVCKGEVTFKNVTPIYGRGNNVREPDDDSNLKIPLRPHARRVESLRQTIQRSAFTFPVEEMIRRLGSRFDLSRDLVQPTEDNPRETADRTHGLLNRILTSRALRREQNQVPPTEVVDLTQDNITSIDTGETAGFIRNQEPSPPVDDRDSFSSIQAVINSESQMDTAVEIDSMVSLSTSSSRRRNEASRVSDMDSGDSRAPRRRRLN